MSFTIFPGHSTLVKSEWEQWTTNRPGTTGEVNGTFLSTPPATTDKLNNNEKAALSVYKMDNTQPSITERIFKLTLAQHDLPPESCLEQSTTTQQQDKGARKLKSSLRLATLQDSRKSSGKAVKFDRLHLEKICLFEETQSPNQVPSSHKVNLPLFKVEYTQWPLVQHILFQQHRQNVQLKRSLKLLQDGTLLHGQVVVRNLGYEKVVEIRYTLDGWQTVKNTQATYLHGRGSLDMFAFDLDIQEGMADRGHRRATIDMAVRYTVTVTDNNYYHRHKEQQYYRHNEEMTFWDNNDGHNYQIQIVASAAKQVVQLNQVTSIDKEKKEAC
ncbi:putative phosphatase regulatory subunit-domain-containing protein, partial [Chlamydoabsidia padenii]